MMSSEDLSEVGGPSMIDTADVDVLRRTLITEELRGITYDFDGVELKEWQAIQRLYRAGFKDLIVLGIMFAIIEGESGSFTKAWHANVKRDDAGKIVRKEEAGATYMQITSIDLGFIQRNVNVTDEWVEMHPEAMGEWVNQMWDMYPNLTDAQQSAEAAYDLYQLRGFQPWYAYKPGTTGFYGKKRRAGKAIANFYERTQVGNLAEVELDAGKFPLLDYVDQRK